MGMCFSFAGTWLDSFHNQMVASNHFRGHWPSVRPGSKLRAILASNLDDPLPRKPLAVTPSRVFGLARP